MEIIGFSVNERSFQCKRSPLHTYTIRWHYNAVDRIWCCIWNCNDWERPFIWVEAHKRDPISHLLAELWEIYYENFWQNKPCYNGTVLLWLTRNKLPPESWLMKHVTDIILGRHYVWVCGIKTGLIRQQIKWHNEIRQMINWWPHWWNICWRKSDRNSIQNTVRWRYNTIQYDVIFHTALWWLKENTNQILSWLLWAFLQKLAVL